MRPTNTNSFGRFFSVREIGRALGVCKPTVRDRARREGWPSQQQHNRTLFAPPRKVAAQMRAYFLENPGKPRVEPAVTFFKPVRAVDPLGDGLRLVLRLNVQILALARLQALTSGLTPVPFEQALRLLAGELANLPLCERSLRTIDERFRILGVAGLLEKRAGRVGKRKKTQEVLP